MRLFEPEKLAGTKVVRLDFRDHDDEPDRQYRKPTIFDGTAPELMTTGG